MMAKLSIALSNSEKISFLSNLSTMLAAGISILEAIDALLEDAKGKNAKFLEILREDIVQGNHLNYSFSKFPHIFDPITVNLIKASEEAGTLEVTLKDLKTNIQKEMEFSDRVKQALIYPILIGIVFIGVLLIIFGIAKLVERFVKAVSLGFLNKLGGAIFGLLKFGSSPRSISVSQISGASPSSPRITTLRTRALRGAR